MANRTKAERNNKILELWDNGKGWRQKSIANMLHIKESAVSMVICRARWGAPKKPHNEKILMPRSRASINQEGGGLTTPAV